MHNMCLQGCAKLQHVVNSFLPFDFFVWNQNVILNTLKCTLMKRLGEIFCKIAAAYNTQAGLIKHGIGKYSALSREQLRLLQVAAAYKRIKGHSHKPESNCASSSGENKQISSASNGLRLTSK